MLWRYLFQLCHFFSINASESFDNIETIGESYGLDREAERQYFEDEIAPKIVSGELTPYRPSAVNSRNTSMLPSSCDNSTSPYFPEIGNQGDIGSCVAFATTYYQFTYESNKLKNISTTYENTYSPQWNYSHTNYGVNNGSRFVDAYYSLNSIGSIRYGDYEENEIVTDQDFVEHWSTNTEAAIKAMGIKGAVEEVLFGEFNELGKSNGIAVTFDTNTESDHYLDGIKAGLAAGDIYVFGCYFNFNEMNASSQGTHAGEKVAVRCCSLQNEAGELYNCNHAVTIVGYDDNICVDVNGDGTIESAEKGAFKVANSWGSSWGNDGFIWVLYDSLNNSTKNSDHTWENDLSGTYRKGFIDDQLVYKLNVYENTNKVFVVIDFETNHKFNTDIYTYRNKDGSVSANELDYTNPNGKSNDGRLFYAPFDGQIVLDYAQSLDTIEDYRIGATWSVGLFYLDELNHNTINSTEIRSITYVDNNMNIVKSYNGDLTTPVYYQPSGLAWFAGSYFYEFDTNIDLIKGDLNYDNIIDINDKTIIQGITAGTVEPSSLQEYLSDLNGDGVVNATDIALLIRLI